MIIKAEKPKLDGVELENVIDLSINIGSSASPSTASISFMGDIAEDVAKNLKDDSLLEVGGLKFYGSEYSVSVTDGQGGLTSTIEMIDQSFNILDRYYVELNIGNHGRGTVDGNSHDDYIFVGKEYYSYTSRQYVWDMSKRTWEVSNVAVAKNSTLRSNQYEALYASYKKTYIKYQRALKNIEVFQGSAGENYSSTCSDNELEPADVLLLPGGAFANQAQVILNFPSMTNPYTTKGEIFYKGGDLGPLIYGVKNPFGGSALFNATGSLRSVISSIAGQLGKSWYWDCTKPASSQSIKTAPDASSAVPYDKIGHTYTKGTTRANSFSDGLVYRRYLEGEEADYASNEWVNTVMGVNGSIFKTIIDSHSRDGQVMTHPTNEEGAQTLLYMELGEELYKALYIAIEGTAFNVTSANKLDQKIIKAAAFKGNAQLASLIEGGEYEDRDGTIKSSTSGTHKFFSYNEESWKGHIAGVKSRLDYMTIWRACGPAGDAHGLSDPLAASRYPWKDYMILWDATVRQVRLPDGAFEYYPVSHEVVSQKNTCFVKGSPQLYKEDDIVKETSFGQVLSLVSADTACDDGELLDKELNDLDGPSQRETIVGDNSTWSYEFPACLKEDLQDWGQGAIVEVQNSIGPSEMGRSVNEYYFISKGSNDLVCAVKNRTWDGGWTALAGSWEKFITAEKVAIRSVCKQSGLGFANDGLYSEGLHLRLCSNGKGKANWGIQSMESGAEVVSTEIDQINSFGGAQCVDKTPFISYTLYGEWDAIEDIGDLDSISVTYGSSGISTSYSRSYKKSVTPSALLYSGFRTSGSQNIINLSPNFNRFSTRFKNAAYSRGIT